MATKKITTTEPAVDSEDSGTEAVLMEAIVPPPVEMSSKQTTFLSETLAKSLQEPFPPEMLRFNKAKGLTYIPISEVIARLNRVLGIENWSYEVVRAWREPDHPDWCLAHVRLAVEVGKKKIVRDGYGGQQVKYKKTGDVVDLGDEFKGAVSDALKKAAQSLGVGLELARTEEAKRWEEEATGATGATDADRAAYESLVALTKQLSTSEKSELRSWWQSQFEGISVSPDAGAQRLNAAIQAVQEIIERQNPTVDPTEMVMNAFPGSEIVGE